MDRRRFLTGTSALLALGGALYAQNTAQPLRLLPMTDLIEGIEERIALSLNVATHDFGNGVASDTFGINHSYLGPVIRAKQGQTLPFDVTNKIGDISTLHWHGLHIPGDVDGGPHQEIDPGSIWSPDVPLVQTASMKLSAKMTPRFGGSRWMTCFTPSTCTAVLSAF